MFKKLFFFSASLVIAFSFYSCTTDALENVESNLTKTQDIDEDLRQGGSDCLNVVIVDGYAYGACNSELVVVELASGTSFIIDSEADDISADAERGLLFTQSGTTITMFSLDDPTAPQVAATVTANFSVFSGLSAANCVLAVSGGAGGSNTRIFNYSLDDLTLTLATDGIPLVDNRTGAPDILVIPVDGGAQGFYSQDLGAVANWGIQIVDFNGSGGVINTPPVVTLTPGQFQGPFGFPFGPANFPVESEFLNGKLYVANFAAEGLEVIDLANNNDLSVIPLGYEPINVATDGVSLFVVASTNSTVDIVNPDSGEIIESLGNLDTPTGVAATDTHIAIADRTLGLIVIPR